MPCHKTIYECAKIFNDYRVVTDENFNLSDLKLCTGLKLSPNDPPPLTEFSKSFVKCKCIISRLDEIIYDNPFLRNNKFPLEAILKLYQDGGMESVGKALEGSVE